MNVALGRQAGRQGRQVGWVELDQGEVPRTPFSPLRLGSAPGGSVSCIWLSVVPAKPARPIGCVLAPVSGGPSERTPGGALT